MILNRTTYHDLPLYEPNDTASLLDGYNKAVIEIDAQLHALENDIELLRTRVKTLEIKEASR